MTTDTWHHCYDAQLTNMIVPDAFSHPAKLAWGLAQRIMDHLREHWPHVTTVCDPMGGVGVVGIAAAYAGYQAILGELEAHFAALAQQNLALHTPKWRALGKPVPWLFRHDARVLPVVVAGSVVCSPPYAGSFQDGKRAWIAEQMNSGRMQTTATVGNVGEGGESSKRTDYGQHPAQIGNLRAVVTSPPWEQSTHVNNTDRMTQGKAQWADGVDSAARVKQDYADYNAMPGDYWHAMRAVYTECARILALGCPMILVVKGYVQKGRYVDLPQQTADLVEQCGFRVVHWHNASLQSREAQLGLFGGETRRERKSFFRRLAEKNGAPPINAEVVLCAERTER